MERSAARAALEFMDCCGLGVLRTLRDAFFTISLAVSLPSSHPMMAEVSGKMIKKTGRTPLQSQDSVGGRSYGSNEDGYGCLARLGPS